MQFCVPRARSNEILTDLADTTKVVDNLKYLRYKAEEAKLITQLAEMDAINYGLFKQAYNASVDLSKLMDRYEMSKLLSGPYDADGACIVITAHKKFWHASELPKSVILDLYY
ncbi:Peptide chain release factor prfb3 protein [Thalictrum thalictroides]|uniref:Peptide chain release factor prfb3 protein n=1 Tax=Thalictrum thalictroides TaxID=46969 RepID=A0A7J6WN75_THATH|nr:Peptide chain release factor prfb3 protein [Thalictrum thalictroides]